MNDSGKARQFFKGRKGQWKRLEKVFAAKQDRPTVWFHCASLGEFEQGRPVIEAYSKQHPDAFILLTFFSPSGYEIRKNYPGADCICYLPLDFPWNARRFIKRVQPTKAYFVKYEFWYFFLTTLKRNHIPTYLFSAIFLPQQPFFKWYGMMYRKILRCYTRIFVQTQDSVTLLHSLRNGKLLPITIAGDTRFDRVLQICAEDRVPQNFKDFIANTNGQPILVAGSSWAEDEKHLVRLLGTFADLQLVLAPHEIHAAHLEAISNLFAAYKPVFFSKYSPTDHIPSSRVLVIDCMGLLSSLYRYANICYIGGGFNPSGIHNTLEAATYGKPILIGPNYNKFQEAMDLVAKGAVVSYSTYPQLEDAARKWLTQPQEATQSGKEAAAYVQAKAGATQTILDA